MCIDVISAYIKRIEDVNPIINAVVETRFKEALEEARWVDDLVGLLDKDDLWNNYPLFGVPISVKEPIGVKGLSHTAGDYHRKGVKANDDALAVKYLKNAGAIVLCVTNIPEWSLGWESQNPIYGRTVNPYNNYRTVGGSSGGEAALVSSAGSLIGMGSDMAGSIRLCASFTGIFGHKPTPNVVSLEGWYPVATDPYFNHIHTFGPLTRYANDLPLMMKVIAGPKVNHLRLDEHINVSKLNVFFIHKFPWSLTLSPIRSFVKEALTKVTNHLYDLGCDVRATHPKHLNDAFEICSAMQFYIKGTPEFLTRTNPPGKPKNIIWEWIKCFVHQSKHSYNGLSFNLLYKMKRILVPKFRVAMYEEKLKEIETQLLAILKDNEVLILPTFPTYAFYHYLLPSHLSGLSYTALFNVLGFPATSVPIMQYKGMPIGVQVVAAPFQDRLCFAVAR